MLAIGLARQHHRADGDRDCQHAAGGRRQHVTLGNLLLRYRPFGGPRLQCIGGDVERRARLIECRPRDCASGKQIFIACEVGLRLGKLGLQACDLRVQRFYLQQKLFVGDRGDDLLLV